MLGSIQALRAIAALGVVIGHLWPEFSRFGYKDFPNFIVGASGVDLFFVISGFVMVYSSTSFFAASRGSRTFSLRRLARIAPLYWLATTLFLVYLIYIFRNQSIAEMLVINDLSWPSIAASYLFWPYPRPGGGTHPALAVGWTLNYEMFFYVVFAIALFLPRRSAVVAVSAALLALPEIVPHLGLSPSNPLNIWGAKLIYEFVYGMWIAMAFLAGWKLPPWLAVMLIAVGIAMVAWTGMDASGIAVLPRHIIWGGAAALIVGGATLCRVDILGRSGAIILLGDSSYALYLLHTTLFAVISSAIPRYFPSNHPWAYAILLVSSAIVAAIAAHLAFERPLTTALRRRIARSRAGNGIAGIVPRET
ncbi:MAG: acyltransferase [Xanthobacteraceae bacterium]